MPSLKSKDFFTPVWKDEDEKKIDKENFANSIYLYLFWDKNIRNGKIKKIAVCKLNKNKGIYKVKCEDILNDEHRIDYLLGVNDISPSHDFQSYEYVTIEDDIGLYNRANDFIYFSYYHNIKEIGKERLYELDKDCRCRMDISSILGSKAFRRLENKAQIYSSLKGDHYRNRLTHTLDVVNIALTIANRVNSSDNALCEKVETIAFGHDIGHTPFGHIGERTLENIIKGKTNIISNVNDESLYNDIGGFKHNIQSVRILVKLENTTKRYKGLNVSYEILEGILKHTEYSINDVKKMIPKEYCDKLNLDLKENTYLSGKIVNFADEIAQRCADIEDAIRSGKINIDDIIKIISKDDYINVIEKYKKCLDIDKEIKAIHIFNEDIKNEEIKREREKLIKECGGKDCIYEAQKIIVRNICDYIAGMTDEFAQTEYMEKVLALSIN